MLNYKNPPPLLSCLIVLGFGYTTGLQLGKIAPFAARLEAELGQGLTYAGLLTSMLALFVACLAVPVSRIAFRAGLSRSLKAAAVVMVAGAVLFGLAGSPATLLAARAVEGAGYVIAAVAAPAYLSTFGSAQWKPALLALWGSVVPVGFALSGLLTSLLPPDLSLSATYLAYALPIAVLAAPVLLLRGDRPCPETTGVAGGRIIWPLVVAYGFYVYLSIGFFAFLPAYLDRHGAGTVGGAAVALCVPAGSISTAVLLSVLGRRAALWLMTVGLGAVALATSALFPAAGANGAAMMLYALGCGMTAASILATVPVLAQNNASATRTIGGIAQAGGAMVLAGAPLAGAVIESGGWQALTQTFQAAALILLGLNLLIWRRTARFGAAKPANPVARHPRKHIWLRHGTEPTQPPPRPCAQGAHH